MRGKKIFVIDTSVIIYSHDSIMNFAEHDANVFGRQKNVYHRYIIESSDDGINWTTIIDKSENNSDNSHDYTQLLSSVSARFLKIRNIEVPGGKFAISDKNRGKVAL